MAAEEANKPIREWQQLECGVALMERRSYTWRSGRWGMEGVEYVVYGAGVGKLSAGANNDTLSKVIGRGMVVRVA